MKNSTALMIGGALALVGAIGATIVGSVFTGWLLVRPSGPTFLDYALFAGLTALVAGLGALPGLLIGLLISRVTGRGKDEREM